MAARTPHGAEGCGFSASRIPAGSPLAGSRKSHCQHPAASPHRPQPRSSRSDASVPTPSPLFHGDNASPGLPQTHCHNPNALRGRDEPRCHTPTDSRGSTVTHSSSPTAPVSSLPTHCHTGNGIFGPQRPIAAREIVFLTPNNSTSTRAIRLKPTTYRKPSAPIQHSPFRTPRLL